MKKELPPLPNTAAWIPRKSRAVQSISQAMLMRCIAIESEIRVRIAAEKASAIDGFDSGLPIEDIVRDVLSTTLPQRYKVCSGTLVDSDGLTAGDADILIFNSLWFPEAKPPSTIATRRRIIPIEGVYAVGEVKQTLSFRTLDDAMEKLICCHRLKRAQVPADRLVENRDFNGCLHGRANPLFSFIIATTIDDELDPLIKRFVEINKTVKRHEVVRALCVLNTGTVIWTYKKDGVTTPALFMKEDLSHALQIGFMPHDELNSSLFPFIENLILHLFHSVLGPEDIISRYGPALRKIKTADSVDMSLPKDSTGGTS